ncbi:MAG: DUF4412 domain-containing protein [Bacteroidota bacterium]
MKRFPAVMSLLVLLSPLVSGQGQRPVLPFEGIIEFKMQNLESVQFFESYIKGDRVRMQTKEKLDYVPIVIQDHGAQTTFFLVTATERYFQAPMSPGTPEPEAQRFEVEQTAEKETIAGLPCELFTVKMADGELEVWATLALGTVAGFSQSLNKDNTTQPTWESYFTSRGYTGARVIIYNAEGHEQGRYELTGVTRKAVPESLLRVPRGYERVADQKDLVPRRR